MIYVIRHGQTDWNVQGKTQGSIDVQLNEKGIKQAEEVREKLANTKLDIVLCSPRTRCISTAEIVCEGRDIPIIEDKDLQERGFGEFEGKKKNSDYNWEDFWNWDKNVQYEKAENIRDFYARTVKFVEKLKTEYAGKNVLVVTHAGICAMMYCHFNKLKPDGRLKIPGAGNCEISTYNANEIVEDFDAR